MSRSSLLHRLRYSLPSRSPARKIHVLVTLRDLQVFLGLSNFFALNVDLGRLHMRPIQVWLASHWVHSLSSIDLPLPVTPDLLEAIEVWSDTEWILQGVPLKSATGSLPVHGQFDGGVGSVSQWEGRLKRIAKSSPHQLFGNVGGQVSTPTLF